MKKDENITLAQLPDGTFLAYHKQYDEATSHGNTPEKALDNLIDAIYSYGQITQQPELILKGIAKDYIIFTYSSGLIKTEQIKSATG